MPWITLAKITLDYASKMTIAQCMRDCDADAGLKCFVPVSVKQTTIDYKTVDRLVSDLAGLGFVQKRSFNLAKQNTLSSSDTKKSADFIFDLKVDLEDEALVSEIIDKASVVSCHSIVCFEITTCRAKG